MNRTGQRVGQKEELARIAYSLIWGGLWIAALLALLPH